MAEVEAAFGRAPEHRRRPGPSVRRDLCFVLESYNRDFGEFENARLWSFFSRRRGVWRAPAVRARWRRRAFCRRPRTRARGSAARRLTPNVRCRDLRFVFRLVELPRFQPDLDDRETQRLARSVAFQNTIHSPRPTSSQPLSKSTELSTEFSGLPRSWTLLAASLGPDASGLRVKILLFIHTRGQLRRAPRLRAVKRVLNCSVTEFRVGVSR